MSEAQVPGDASGGEAAERENVKPQPPGQPMGGPRRGAARRAVGPGHRRPAERRDPARRCRGRRRLHVASAGRVGPQLSAVIFQVSLVSVIHALCWAGEGIHDIASILYPVAILTAALMLDRGLLAAVTVACIASVAILVHQHPQPADPDWLIIFDVSLILIITAVAVDLLLRGVLRGVAEARSKERRLSEAYAETRGPQRRARALHDRGLPRPQEPPGHRSAASSTTWRRTPGPVTRSAWRPTWSVFGSPRTAWATSSTTSSSCLEPDGSPATPRGRFLRRHGARGAGGRGRTARRAPRRPGRGRARGGRPRGPRRPGPPRGARPEPPRQRGEVHGGGAGAEGRDRRSREPHREKPRSSP